jgi:hypothetical protein
MDEARVWATEVEATQLLRLAVERATLSRRKWQLFACLCVERAVHRLGASAQAALAAADVESDVAEALEAHLLVLERISGANPYQHTSPLHASSLPGHRKEIGTAVKAFHYLDDFESHGVLIREIFGNPFRVIDLDTWRTDTAIALARQMHESRDFSPMPILADALQDAGCDNDELLDHCRGPGPHARGCWVVDLVLGNE